MEIVPASDRALLLRLDDHDSVIAVARALESASIDGVTSYSPAYDSLLVRFDPSKVQGIEESLRTLANAAAATHIEPRQIVLPVVFDGPDLEEVAAAAGLSPSDVVDVFCRTKYRVYFLGFAPGFAYLGDVDERIAAPRRPTPRKSVPAGSVGIAGKQTGIYPFETPGGWNLIGRCLLRMFDIECSPPSLLQAGDRVRFERA